MDDFNSHDDVMFYDGCWCSGHYVPAENYEEEGKTCIFFLSNAIFYFYGNTIDIILVLGV